MRVSVVSENDEEGRSSVLGVFASDEAAVRAHPGFAWRAAHSYLYTYDEDRDLQIVSYDVQA